MYPPTRTVPPSGVPNRTRPLHGRGGARVCLPPRGCPLRGVAICTRPPGRFGCRSSPPPIPYYQLRPHTLLPLGLPIPTRPFHGRGDSGVSTPWGICLPYTIPPRGVPIPKRPWHGQRDLGVSHTYHTPMGYRYTEAALSWSGALGCIRCLGAVYHAYHTAMRRDSAVSAAKGLCLPLPHSNEAYLSPHNPSMAGGTGVHALLRAYYSTLPYSHGPFLAP